MEVGTSPCQAWQAQVPTPLQRSLVSLLLHLLLGCSKGLVQPHQNSRRSREVSSCTPLCGENFVHKGCGIYTSPCTGLRLSAPMGLTKALMAAGSSLMLGGVGV